MFSLSEDRSPARPAALGWPRGRTNLGFNMPTNIVARSDVRQLVTSTEGLNAA